MKKILKLFLCLFTFMIASKTVMAVEQNYIYLGDEIPNVRLHLKTPDVEKNKKMYQIINRNTGELVYCIEPGVVLKNGYFNAYQDIRQTGLQLTDEDWQQMLLIAYFGYGYEGREDLKWYTITQFMIWDYLLEDTGEIYFINDKNEKINLYQEEINLIKEDMKHYYDLPTFMSADETIKYTAKLNEKVTLVDEANLIGKFSVNTNQEYSISGNEFTISFTTPGTHYVYFWKDSGMRNMAKIFCSPSSQTVMNRGILDIPVATIQFDIPNPTFTFTKKSSGKSSLSLAGAKYGIFYENGYLYKEFTTDEEGRAEFLIDLGSWYLQELEAPYGYELNPEKIYFEVIDGDVTLEGEDSLIYKRIMLEKYLEHIDGSLSLEKNAQFSVYDAKTEELVTSFTTDEYGKYELTLPYGEYILKQTASTEGYKLASDIFLTIDDETEDLTILSVLNPEIKGSLIINKIDQDSEELILEEASFQIWDVVHERFLTIDGEDTFQTIEGKLYIENIPYGSYELVEVEAPEGYQISFQRYAFSVTEDEEEITINVTNELKKGTLVIEKVDENLQPLEGVLFGLYDDCGNLMETYYTDKDGKIMIENLLEGTYFIEELETVSGYERLEGLLSVEVKADTVNTFKVTNRLQIEVPKTGTNEFLLTILFASLCLIVGAFICNYDQDH